MKSPWITWPSITALLPPVIARTRLARMATRYGAAIGTKPIIPAASMPICRHRPRLRRLMCRSFGCWAAILFINMAIHPACSRSKQSIQTQAARRIGRYFSIIVVAEGAKFAADVDTAHRAPVITDMGKDEFGHVRLGGIGQILANEIEHRTR